MTNIPSISVVIPMHNEAENIGACLEALAAQDLMPTEVIVVDNNSTDSGVEKVVHTKARFPSINLVLASESTPGPAAARNKGIALAKGDVIAFTDADCVPDRQWIYQIRQAFEQDQTLDAVGGVERPYSYHSTLVHRVVSATWLPPRNKLKMGTIGGKHEWLTGTFISTFNCAVKRACLDEIGGFDERYYPCGEDMDLWFRAMEKMAKIVAWHPDIIVEHHQALSMPALLRKMFFYGEALSHLAGQHFRGHLFFVSQWFGVKQIKWLRVSGIIWNQSIMALPSLFIIISIGIVSPIMLLPILVLFLMLLAWNLRRSILKRGYSISWLELPFALAIYSLRTLSRELGLCFGSLKHRVVCI